MNRTRLSIAVLLLLALGVGGVAADAVTVEWTSNGEPPDVVGPDDSIPVAVDVTLEEDADVCLMQERSWRSNREIFCHNDVSPGDDNQDIHFRTDPDELGLDPGDEASLYVEVEEQGWFSDDDTTTVETVTVEEIIDAEVTDIEVDRGPHVQGETVEISVTVENTGNADANVFYGFGIHHEDGETVKEREDTIPLDVDQSGTETFSWTVDDDASLGDYWIGMNLWESRDRSEQLYAGRDRDGFEVSAPELRVSPSERDVGEIDRDDPPTVEYEVENTGHGDLDWEIISGTRAVTDVNDDGFVVSYAEPGDFTVDISVLARNEQTLGDGSAEVTYRGVGTVPPEPPEATTIQPGGGTLIVGDEMEFDGLAETGSDGVPEEAGGVSDLDYAWRVAGDVERESSGQTRSDVPEAVDTIQVEFESAGETEIEFSVTDTETGLSDDIDAPATVDVQPFELSGQVTDSEFDDPIRAATVYVNDREVATTDSDGTYSAELTELEAQDRHDIRIEPPAHSDDGFHTHEDTFSTDAREMTIDAELEATAQDVRFEVSDVTSIDGYEPTGDPIRDAKIDVDGTVHETNDEGRVDVSLDAGEYQYEVTAPEYESVTGELTVRDGEGLHIEAVQLIREDAGLLEVDVVDEDGNSVSPIDWELYLDDEPVQLDAQGRTVVTEGERTLSVETEEDAYADTQREVTITSGEVTTETIDVSSEISADIELRDHDDGTVEEGEGVEALVDVTNTGNVEHTFFVGFSAIGPEGEAYDNDETTGTAVQLAPDETATETLVWEVEPDLPSGQYDLTVAVWEESDRDALKSRITEATEENAIVVGSEEDADDIVMNVERDGQTQVAAPIAIGVDEVRGEPAHKRSYEYDWAVSDYPEDSSGGDLLPEWSIEEHPAEGEERASEPLMIDGERHVNSFTPDAEGEYTIEVRVLEDGELLGTETVEILVFDPVESMTGLEESELIHKYAPIVYYHSEENFTATRYEAYLENAEMRRSFSNPDSTPLGNLNKFTLGDVDAYEYSSPESTSNSLYLLGEIEDFKRYQQEYSPTVHASVSQTTFQGDEYTAVTYWRFYLFDPKKDHDRADWAKESLTAHPSDTETVTVLIDEEGPQYVGAAQHFSGTYTEWERVVPKDDQLEIYSSKGAHATFFTDSSLYEGTIPGQTRWIREWLDTPRTPRGLTAADDVTEQGETWTLTGDTGDVDYDLIMLTDDMEWGNFAGPFDAEPGGVAYDILDGGALPMQRERWDPGPWMEDRMIHMEDDGVVSASIDDPELDDGEVDPTVVLPITNDGVHPHKFNIKIEMKRTDGTWDQDLIHSEVVDERLGFEQSEQILVSLDQLNLPDEELDVRVSLYSYDPRTTDLDDPIETHVLDDPLAGDVAADITSVNYATGEYTSGDEVTTTVEIENTGSGEHTFFVGYSAIGPEDDAYDNEGTTGTTETIPAGERREVELSWEVPATAPEGHYDLVTAVWLESDRDELQTRLADDERAGPIEVTESAAGTLVVDTFPEDATVTVDGDQHAGGEPIELPEGEYTATAERDGYVPEEIDVTIRGGEVTEESVSPDIDGGARSTTAVRSDGSLFDVAIDGFSEVDDGGDMLEATISVGNVGDEDDEQTIAIHDQEGMLLDDQEVSLSAGESTHITFSIDPAERDEELTDLTVRSADASVTEEVITDEETPPEDESDSTGTPADDPGDGVDLPDIDVDVDVEALVDELLDLLEDLISVAQPDAQYQP